MLALLLSPQVIVLPPRLQLLFLAFSMGALVSMEVAADQNNWPWQKLKNSHRYPLGNKILMT
jgi:alpha-beta hydrolase superfamily lysophospholipase